MFISTCFYCMCCTYNKALSLFCVESPRSTCGLFASLVLCNINTMCVSTATSAPLELIKSVLCTVIVFYFITITLDI